MGKGSPTRFLEERECTAQANRDSDRSGVQVAPATLPIEDSVVPPQTYPPDERFQEFIELETELTATHDPDLNLGSSAELNAPNDQLQLALLQPEQVLDDSELIFWMNQRKRVAKDDDDLELALALQQCVKRLRGTSS